MEKFQNFLQYVSRWSVFTLLALTPVFIFPASFVSIAQAKLILASVLLGVAILAWFLGALLGRGLRIPKNPIFFAVILLPAAYITSALIAGWPASALVSGLGENDTVVTAVLFAVASLLTALTVREASVIVFIRTFVVGAAALLLLHIGRLFFPEALAFAGALPNSTASAAGSWHDLGIVLGLLVIVCGSFIHTRVAETPLWEAIFGGTALLAFLFLIIVSMQDIWFVLAGVMGLFGVYAWFRGSEHANGVRAIRAALWLAVAIAAFVFGWFNVALHDRLPDQLTIVSVEVRPSWEGTLSVGQNSLTSSRSLIFGTGPNSFARNWAQFKPEGVNETLFWNLDFNNGVGAVPTSFVTIGILGMGAWVLLMLAFLWSSGEALRRTKLFGAEQTAIFGIVCAVIFLFAFHVMYAPGIAISLLLFLFLGALISITSANKLSLDFSLETVAKFLGSVAVAALSFGALFGSVVSVLAITSDITVNRSAALYNSEGNIGNSSALIQQALRVWPSNDRAHRAAVELGILELAQLGQKAGTDETARQLETTLAQTIEHGLKAVSIDRADYQNWLILAQLYQELAGAGIAGAYEQARQAYTSAREENPTSPLPLFRLAQLEILQGNTSTAIDLFGEAVKLKRDFAPAYFLQSQLLAQQNRLEDAIASGATAVQLVPEDPLGWYNLGVILYVKGSFNEAGAAFAQAVTLRNDYSNALFMLGLTYEQVGAPEQAIVALARVLELNPNEASVPLIIQNIRDGKEPFNGLAQEAQTR